VIGYLDTSAFVPLLVVEPSTPLCRRLWDDADAVVSSRLLYVEAAAALAQGVRIGRLTEKQRRRAVTLLDDLWREFEVVEVDEPLAREAADLAHRYGLRGYDALHRASAYQLDDGDDLVAAAGDQALLAAWAALGLSTLDANQDPVAADLITGALTSRAMRGTGEAGADGGGSPLPIPVTYRRAVPSSWVRARTRRTRPRRNRHAPYPGCGGPRSGPAGPTRVPHRPPPLRRRA